MVRLQESSYSNSERKGAVEAHCAYPVGSIRPPTIGAGEDEEIAWIDEQRDRRREYSETELVEAYRLEGIELWRRPYIGVGG